jgi:hypothetical protein
LRLAVPPQTCVEQVLVVRPHRVRVAASTEIENVLPGTIVSVVYLGDRLRIAVTVAGCGELLIDAVPGTIGALQEGDAIRVALPREACVVV